MTKILYDCNKCGLSKEPLDLYSQGESKLLFVGEAPGAEEEKRRIPFIGTSGKFLRNILFRKKLKHFHITNAVGCRPPGNKMSDTYLRCCRDKLVETISNVNPTVIVCLGESAANSVLNLLGMKEGITKLRNRIIPNYEFNCLVYCTYHPAGVLRQEWKLTYTFEKDLERIIKLYTNHYHSKRKVKKILESRNILSDIKIEEIKTIDQLMNVIKKIEDTGEVAFDYETTNLKPYDYFHEVYSAAFAIGKQAWGIYFPKLNQELLQAFKENIFIKVLNNEHITKIIQNFKFEELVTRYWMFGGDKVMHELPEDYLDEYGCIIKNIEDPMLATHVIDERSGCTSLDFQNLVRFGLKPYNDKVKKYLIPESKEDKTNKIADCPPNDLLEYNCKDTITTWYNWKTIDENFLDTGNFRWCYEFLKNGHRAFANMSWNGIPVNMDTLNSLESDLEEKKQEIYEQIMNLPDVKDFIVNNYDVPEDYNSSTKSITRFELKTKLSINLTSVDDEPKRKLTLRKKS